MADGDNGQPEARQSHEELVQEQLERTAHEQVTQAMDQAMAELPARLSPQKEMAPKEPEKPPSPSPVPMDDEDVDYVEPMQDPYGKAIKYLEQHNILQLFQQLTTSIVYTKPEKPLDHMVMEVERMKKLRDAEKQTS